MSHYSDVVKRSFQAVDDLRDAGLKAPERVSRRDNLVYGKNKKWNRLDLYRPETGEKGKLLKLPVIVSIHGGAWIYGDKERYQYYCMSLCRYGFAVINFSYRLAPEHKYPAPVEDTATVFEWISKNAEACGLDTEAVFAVGDSAGASILCSYLAYLTDERYAEKLLRESRQNSQLAKARHQHELPKIRAAAVNCGIYSVRARKNKPADFVYRLMKDVFKNGGTEEEVDLLEVAEAVNDRFPPMFVMTSASDFLKDQAPILMDALDRNGIPYEYHYYDNGKLPAHNLAHIFHCNMKLVESTVCNREECEYFKNLLKEQDEKKIKAKGIRND